jgi:hypothetical protein
MRKLNLQWTVGLTLAAFAKGCVYPGWASVAELLCCLALVAFLSFFRPRPSEVTELERRAIGDLETMREQMRTLREEIGSFKLQLGFRSR